VRNRITGDVGGAGFRVSRRPLCALALLAGLAFLGLALERTPAAEQKSLPAADPLPRILEKTRDYCNRLETASLYFVCRERIEERQYSPPLSFSFASSATGGPRHVIGVSLEYDYQLVRTGATIGEKRTLLREGGQPRNEPNAPLRTKLYKHKYLVFGPVGLLGGYWQPRHLYAYLGEDVVDKEKAFLIEARPAGPPEPDLLYGKVWVRKKDFAIVKIEWDQTCLGHFEKVQQMAEMIGHGAEPKISIICLYGIEKNGIRFPSGLTTREDYDSKKGLFRVSEATVVYRDYRFFIVETEVRY
jgi:hypothetical protein